MGHNLVFSSSTKNLCNHSLPTLPSQSDFEACSECQRQGGKAEGFVVMFIGEIFDSSVESQMRVQSVTSAEIDFLVALSQIPVGQKHGGAKETIRCKCAVIAAAD